MAERERFHKTLRHKPDILPSLREGMAGSAGYSSCTSNCAYTGLPWRAMS